MTSRLVRIMAALVLATGVSRTSAEAQDAASRLSRSGIAFTPCAENAALDCGTLRVPLDYCRPPPIRCGGLTCCPPTLRL